MNTQKKVYPVNIRGELTIPPGGGWWLLKWLLIIPHLFVLFFLYIGFAVAWIISFFAILFTGKYPEGLFKYNVGVLRWTWRMGFYSYQALGTDKYPPFSLQPDPDYPADLEVAYPEKLSNGLVLIKWWLLAIPHYIIVGIFQGWRYVGLVTILAIIAAIVVLFTGKYPAEIFKLVIGMDRWSYRVYAYASLMTDEYPPFRLWDD
jgi:Na+/H+ antiporter NhaC